MYQLIKERLSREEAVEACRSRGMNDRPALLANVHDRATQTCMREMMMSDGVYDPADWADQPSKFLVGVWIGLNDIDVENQFVWTYGTKLVSIFVKIRARFLEMLQYEMILHNFPPLLKKSNLIKRLGSRRLH